MNDFSYRLKNLRIEQGFTQERLGESVGLTKQAISRMEKNKNKYSYSSNDILLERLAFQLKCTPDYLLGLSDEKGKDKNGNQQVIRIDPDAEVKIRMEKLCVKDKEFTELVLECYAKLKEEDINVIKRVLGAMLK